MGRDRQQKANKERQKRNSKTVAGKTSLSDLVSAGLLQAGATVVCNSWPFTATVSAAGRLDAQWTVPSDFAQPLAGAEFMRAEFDTPSAWATAVCRVMRAQTRSNGESRVAVNGWTACRIQMPSESGSDEPTEISLDALRREFTARHAADSDESNAVDGLAQQVAQSLALGCVSQRRAAAAATTAMAPGRKRKSIPDMARHTKLSRVPTADSSDAEIDDALVRLALDAYQAAADAYPRDERKAVGARRRQTLRQAIAAAADAWLSARHLRHSQVLRTVEPGVAATLVPQSAAVLPRLCVACGSAGTAALHSCHVCGDGYHGFCAPTSSAAADRRFVCPACSVCATCLVADPADLRACDACGLSTHARCSRQQADKTNSGSSTRWLCDGCVRCLECGFTMDSDVSDWDTRVSWAYDSCVCGHCAAQIGRGRVCPECVSTYADAASASTMVCCDVCALWIHPACDPSLTPPVYDALITREDAAYVCPTCVQPPEAPADCLPQCLRVFSCSRDLAPSLNGLSPLPEIGVKPEIETEAANLLLSLTQSDIRFDYERFTLDRLQSRFCLSTGDSRSCTLCGLLGDGFSGAQQLGRLIPFGSSNSMPAPLWAHVECLAWAWGPRSVEADGMVRFEGTLMDADPNASPQNCTLCTRSGPTFHCCAPVPCPDSAFHLPCLLAAATLPSAWEIQYSAAWRRALCSTHAPKYSAMMPMDDPTVQPLSLADTCVKSQVTYASIDIADHFTRIGNLVVLSWGSVSDTGMPVVVDDLCFPSDGFYIVRYLYVADTCYTLGLQTVSSTWRGWISPMPLALSAVPATEMTLDTISDYQLSDLLAQLLRQHPIDQFLVDLAIAHPLRFLGLDRYQSAFQSLLDCNVRGYERLLLSESAISIPTNTLLHSHISPTLNDSTNN
ncbi:hypothetical protein H4S07_000514 [Coemansia furcata]|uniref:Uncharacterized protein n=1 Tax=Coemansia furcata TaxID=417177 RepID=A0ACC1LRX6_9FUNG|nr:hypothetical protein H4S07_000514 [Coemansia furcata]